MIRNPIDILEDLVQKGIDESGADLEIDRKSFDHARDILDKPPEELDNCVMSPEEMMNLFPWPIWMLQQLCDEINEDAEAGHY